MHLLLLLLVCLALGAALGRLERLPPQAPAVLNAWIVDVALPALVVLQIPRLQLDPRLLFLAGACWFVFAGALVLMPVAGRLAGWPPETVGALVLTCGLGNTAFMGYPLVEALRGGAALGPAVLADQLGSFLALSTGGLLVAAAYSGVAARPAQLAASVLRAPPFLALLVGAAARAAGGWPAAVEAALQRLADTMTPLALFSVGMQFRLGALRGQRAAIAVGLSWKMVLAPLGVLLSARALGLGRAALATQVAVLQAAMGPMITAGVLASRHRLAPPLATALVGLGTLLALVLVPAWAWLLHQ